MDTVPAGAARAVSAEAAGGNVLDRFDSHVYCCSKKALVPFGRQLSLLGQPELSLLRQLGGAY